jgi:hypothetical protein
METADPPGPPDGLTAEQTDQAPNQWRVAEFA